MSRPEERAFELAYMNQPMPPPDSLCGGCDHRRVPCGCERFPCGQETHACQLCRRIEERQKLFSGGSVQASGRR
jgi:hypothetical protein